MEPGQVLPRGAGEGGGPAGSNWAWREQEGSVAGQPGKGFIEMCYRMRTPKREGQTLVKMEG